VPRLETTIKMACTTLVLEVKRNNLILAVTHRRNKPISNSGELLMKGYKKKKLHWNVKKNC